LSGAQAKASLPPIANLIPERTYIAASFSKFVAPGSRVAYLLAPDVAAEQTMRSALQATTQMPPRLMVALLTHWIRSGIADEIVKAIRNEATGRQQLARRLLMNVSFAARPSSHNLWLPLSTGQSGTELLSHLMRRGLAVVGEDAFVVGDNAPRSIRVSLGAARNRSELNQGFTSIIRRDEDLCDPRDCIGVSPVGRTRLFVEFLAAHLLKEQL
jgi:DNA-binding transcriptional MocR family regulator